MGVALWVAMEVMEALLKWVVPEREERETLLPAILVLLAKTDN